MPSPWAAGLCAALLAAASQLSGCTVESSSGEELQGEATISAAPSTTSAFLGTGSPSPTPAPTTPATVPSAPSAAPTPAPTPPSVPSGPSAAPAPAPTPPSVPSGPSALPTPAPTPLTVPSGPSASPTPAPTPLTVPSSPSAAPTPAPTPPPVTLAPSAAPTPAPTEAPVTLAPSVAPTSAPTEAPTSAPTIGQTEISTEAWDHILLLNQLRKDGFNCTDGTYYEPGEELQLDCRLWKASYLHSRDMADRGYFSHTTLDTGESPWDRASEQGISANGENIAAGSSSAEGALNQWKNSAGHCRNMMNPNMKLVGVGYALGDINYRHYWTQMFSSLSLDPSEVDVSCYPAV